MAAKELQKASIKRLINVRESIGRKLGTEGYVVAGLGGDMLYAYVGEGKGYKGAALMPANINPVIFNTSKAAQRVASDGVYKNGNGNVIKLEVVEAASYFNELYNRATQYIEQAEEIFNKQ